MPQSTLHTAWLLALTVSIRLVRDFAIVATKEHLHNFYLQSISSAPGPSALQMAWDATTRPGLILCEAIYASGAFVLQLWLDQAFPIRGAKSKIDERDLEVMQRLLATGQVQRAGVKWSNLFIKWLLETFLFTGVMGMVVAAIAGQPFTVYNAIPAIRRLLYITWEPWTSIPAYLYVRAEYRVQVRDVMEMVLHMLVCTIAGIGVSLPDPDLSTTGEL